MLPPAAKNVLRPRIFGGQRYVQSFSQRQDAFQDAFYEVFS
jgi:DNA gyrase inhibitor GyrI